jgi:hypothetical protein
MPSAPFTLLARRLDDLTRPLEKVARGDPTWAGHSQAAAEIAADSFAGAWSSRPVQESLLLAHGALIHATDHMRAISVTIRTDGIVVAPLTLLRPVLEAIAHAYYLSDPGITSRERVRRGMNAMLESYVEQLNLATSIDHTTRAADHYRRRIFAIKASAAQHGFDYRVQDRSRLPPGVQSARWLDERPPRDQRLITELLSDVEVEGDIGKLMHRLTSALAHAQPHGLRQFLIREEAQQTEQPGIMTAPLGVSFGNLALWIACLVYGVHRFMLRGCALYGWDEAAWQRSAQPVLAQWREWIS